MNIGCFLKCECSLKVCFLILLSIVIPHVAGRRFHLLQWRKTVRECGREWCISSVYKIRCNRITGSMVQEVAHTQGPCNSRLTLKVSEEMTSMVHINIDDRSLVLRLRMVSGEYGLKWLSRDYGWRTRVVSIAQAQFSAPPHCRDAEYSPSWASSTYSSLWTNLGGCNAHSGRNIQECHWQDNLWNWFQTGEHVPCGKCESHPAESETQYWQPGKLTDYPPCFLWYVKPQHETIKQRPTLIQFMEFWDFWWAPFEQD